VFYLGLIAPFFIVNDNVFFEVLCKCMYFCHHCGLMFSLLCFRFKNEHCVLILSIPQKVVVLELQLTLGHGILMKESTPTLDGCLIGLFVIADNQQCTDIMIICLG